MNLLSLPDNLPPEEWTQVLACDSAFRLERIISTGQVSPDGFYYDQEEDEWVVLLQGSARIAYGPEEENREVTLEAGDFLYLPAHQRHRVSFTSHEPPCIWLCIFKKPV